MFKDLAQGQTGFDPKAEAAAREQHTVKCKRCKRILKSARARVLGYGSSCFKKVKFINKKTLLSGADNGNGKNAIQKTKNIKRDDA